MKSKMTNDKFKIWLHFILGSNAFASLAPLRAKLNSTLFSIGFIFLSLSSFANPDRAPETKIHFSPFKDTIVGGFEIEIQITSDYDISNLSITSTNCSVMLKDAEKGIYVVKAPMTSNGKTSMIRVSRKLKNGNFSEIAIKEVPIVSMTKEMRKRYTNYLMHKK